LGIVGLHSKPTVNAMEGAAVRWVHFGFAPHTVDKTLVDDEGMHADDIASAQVAYEG
jgi:hypothetical protein